MLPKKQGLASTIGNAKDFSEIDLAKINRMYRCDQRAPPPAAPLLSSRPFQNSLIVHSSLTGQQRVSGLGAPVKAQTSPIYAPNPSSSSYLTNYYSLARPLPPALESSSAHQYLLNHHNDGSNGAGDQGTTVEADHRSKAELGGWEWQI